MLDLAFVSILPGIATAILTDVELVSYRPSYVTLPFVTFDVFGIKEHLKTIVQNVITPKVAKLLFSY
jgi:hypothetical protein